MQLRRSCLRLVSVRKLTLTKGIVLALGLTVASLLCLAYYVSHFTTRATEQTPTGKTESEMLNSINNNNHVSLNNDNGVDKQVPQFNVSHPVKLDSRVLVLVETHYTHQGRDILIMLQYNRFRYKVELASKSLPNLTHKDKGKFSLVIFERFESYLNMDKWNRELLDKYCRAYRVGLIAFTYPEQVLFNAQARGFPLSVHTQLSLKHFEMNPKSPVLRIAKAGDIYEDTLPGSDWTVFQYKHPTYVPIAWAKVDSSTLNIQNKTSPQFTISPHIKHITAVQDKGLYDGIERVIFGNHLQFWMHKMLLVDAVTYLTHGRMTAPLERYMLIDVDDIFVGRTGVRMNRKDVLALVESQAELAKKVPGFHFNLGYSGKFFHSGNAVENDGDDALIEQRDQFWWFGHMWSHAQPHKLNSTEIKHELTLNKQFAKQYDIPVNQSYAVAPHHSGVFPIHEELYDMWRRVGGVKVTSTEEYPHLKPPQHRRGYIHRGVKVLPRQTCGLFTHTVTLDEYPDGGPQRLHRSIYGGELFLTFLSTPVLPRQTCGLYTKNLLLADYPGGPRKLKTSIHGGELFLTFLYTPVMVFMTHMSNYGNDRLGLYTFHRVVDFVQRWTNLKLMTKPPTELARIYFELYPFEKNPVWRNPCDDKRHMEIWSSKKDCQHLPELLVIGPQKTGTTALYSFLNMHPAIISNYNSPNTFEEVQFFGNKNYNKGIDWYLEFFPTPPPNRTKPLIYEKSATYFDSELTPLRVYSLLPDSKLISILIDPVDRAYSWYQHQRAHDHETALKYTFYEVVTVNERSSSDLRDLHRRCLTPGHYAQHLETWLDYYPSSQILILDGEELRSNPITVMDKVQLYLDIKPYMDYSLKLKFKPDKGFYCQVIGRDHTKCLGPSKGRNYPPMDEKSRTVLHNYFRKYNIALSKLLGKIGQEVPSWLQDDLAEGK